MANPTRQATFDEIEMAIDHDLTYLPRKMLSNSPKLKSSPNLTASSLIFRPDDMARLYSVEYSRMNRWAKRLDKKSYPR